MKTDNYNKYFSAKVKARFNYTCARCGSTENIQAHDPTGQHQDPLVGVALCGECHSLEHPNVPKSLFINKRSQPYWHNISARTLAKELGCHCRTIIRITHRLDIPFNCKLSEVDKTRIKQAVSQRGQGRTPAKVRVLKLKCKRCGHEWVPRKPQVYLCPKCKSPRWNE